MSDCRTNRCVFAGLLIAALALRILFFAVSVRNVPPSTDECLSPLQAERILAGHLPLLVMANPYQFPVESYLFVPFVRLLPHNALGARLIPFLEGLAALAAFLLVARRISRGGWPAWLLLLFPSAYLTMILSAYAIPQHCSFILLSALTLLAALASRDSERLGWVLAAVSGFLAGLAVSNHLLGLSLLVMTGLYVSLGEKRWKGLSSAVGFGAGAVIGLVPYVAAKCFIPGAYGLVTRFVPLHAIPHRLWSPLFIRTLPAAFGINPCVFPDTRDLLGFGAGAETGFSIAFLAVLFAATGVSIGRFVRRSLASRWPVVSAGDVFVGVSWVGLALFVLNERSVSHSYRYLLPVVLAFPFVVLWLWDASPRAIRVVLGAAVVALACMNGSATLLLVRQWARPEFAAKEPNIYGLKPALENLEQRGIRNGYASYWVAYRVNFESDGKVLCSQPYNERFFGFPLPYKDDVDASTNVAFVLAPETVLTPQRFEQDLAAAQISCATSHCGDFTIYTDFQSRHLAMGKRLASLDVLANMGCPMKSADVRWIYLKVPTPVRPARVVTFYSPYVEGSICTNVQVHTSHGWRSIASDAKPPFQPFYFDNQHPIYGRRVWTTRVEDGPVDAVRAELAAAATNAQWTVDAISVFGGP